MASRSLNKVMLIGNLTRDPDVRYTPTGTSVASFAIATNRSWTPADGGEKQERVDYHNIVAWSKLADICGQLLHKGDKVYLEGRLQTRDWKAQDGSDRRITEIVIDNMMLLRSTRSGESLTDVASSSDDADDEVTAAPKASRSKKKAAKGAQEAPVEEEDQLTDAESVADDIPF
jgi:single-strand DNA-binding protein